MSIASLQHETVAAHILAVELDDLTLGRVKAAVRGSEFALLSVSFEQALARVRADEGRAIVLVEWADADAVERARFCESLWQVSGTSRCYIVALGGPAVSETFFQAAEGPVNDTLRRPFDRNVVLARMRHALRSLRTAEVALSPTDALQEGLRHGSGEVCVRAGDTVARIHLEGGYIVWANVSTAPATMEDLIAHAGCHVDRDVLAAVKEEGRTTGAHFMDVLVKWGMLERERAREAVRTFVSRQVATILALPDAKALFLPRAKPRACSDQQRFRESEISALHGSPVTSPNSAASQPIVREPRPASALSDEVLGALLAEVMATEGAVSAAVLDRRTGFCLAHRGAEPDAEIAWSQVTALAALGPSAEEILAASGDQCFVTRPLRSAPTLVLSVGLTSAVSLGFARAAIKSICDDQRAAATGVR